MRKKLWPFHATDFQTLMHPCFSVCRIIGMFPYKINASTFEISRPYYILSSVVVCLYCVFYLVYIHDIFNIEIITYEYVSFNLNGFCYFTFNGLIAIITHVLTNPRMRLLQTISEIYSKLPSESHQMLSRLIHTKDILGIIITILDLLFYFSSSNREMNYWRILFRVVEVYLEMLGFQMNMLYVNCICVLKSSFKKINDDLMHMQSDMISDMKPSVASFICHMRMKQLFLMEVKTLMKQHLMISETVQELNLIFSVQLLAAIILALSEIIFGLYDFVEWQDGVHIYFESDVCSFLSSLMAMIYFVSQITLIAWACETCKNQAHEIGTSVCNVLNTIRDEQIKGELRLFSLQVLHHKNTFSVKGLTMDATLLTDMVGGITTYMLILIQFMIMSHSADENFDKIHK